MDYWKVLSLCAFLAAVFVVGMLVWPNGGTTRTPDPVDPEPISAIRREPAPPAVPPAAPPVDDRVTALQQRVDRLQADVETLNKVVERLVATVMEPKARKP
jgi:hypothetical protein